MRSERAGVAGSTDCDTAQTPSFPYLHIFGPISSSIFRLSADALSTIEFCVDCPVYLSIEGTSVVKTDSEEWTGFLGRRTVLPFPWSADAGL